LQYRPWRDVFSQNRIDASSVLHHIIARGIDRNTIFGDDFDRKNFIDRLATILNETKTVCYAWALIPNHFHLLLRTGLAPVATVMRRLLTGYAMSYNLRHQRHGHLFQNRYKSILCQEDIYLLELVRYIHLNPLRAGIVVDLNALDRFRFAGHSVVMAKGKYPRLVQARSLLCYWAVRELGMRMSELSRKLKLSQPAVSLSVKRGEKIAKEHQYSLIDDTNL